MKFSFKSLLLLFIITLFYLYYILSVGKMANRTPNAINMRLLNIKIRTYESTIAFAQQTGMLPSALTCPCGSYVDKFRIEEKKNGWRSAYFKCHKKNCKTKVNIRKKTLFENTKLRMHQVFLLMYTFTQFLTYDKVCFIN